MHAHCTLDFTLSLFSVVRQRIRTMLQMLTRRDPRRNVMEKRKNLVAAMMDTIEVVEKVSIQKIVIAIN